MEDINMENSSSPNEIRTYGSNNQWTLEELKERFSVKIERGASPVETKQAIIDLNVLLEEATFEYSAAKSRKEQLELGFKRIKSDTASRLWMEKLSSGSSRKGLSSDGIKECSEHAAYSELGELLDKTIDEFNIWDGIIKMLRNQIELTNQITWNNSISQKANETVGTNTPTSSTTVFDKENFNV